MAQFIDLFKRETKLQIADRARGFRWGTEMTVNYEVEYDNRGRVPEHPAILGRMAEDAKAYRASALAAKRAELDVVYGSSPRQIVDIFLVSRPARMRRSRCSSMAATGARCSRPLSARWRLV